MRFLHTSDWHLGRSLRGFNLHEAQAHAVNGLVATAIAEGCDAFVIAGDVFDRAFPPVESVRVFSDALAKLHEANITCIVIAGNHDSGPRLAVYSELLNDGVYIVGNVKDFAAPIVVRDALVYALPYLDPDEFRTALAEEGRLERSHHAVISAAMDRVRTDLETRAHDGPVVLVAHAFVAGGASSQSERDIAVGGVPVVDAAVFEGVDYVALGHLHRPQTVTAETVIEYSGSLLRYSISEAEHVKRAVIVDVSEDSVERRDVEIEQPREMARLVGSFEELIARTEHADSFVELIVTDERMPERMHPRLRAAFPFAMQIKRSHTTNASDAVRGGVEGKTPEQTLVEFFTKTTGFAPNDEERAVIAAVLES
mgnify:CR=1 FL=1